jgi:hypothetical protein
VAPWSLFEKRDVDSLNRVLSARTLDGYRIRAKLAVNLTRLMSEAEAEALAQSYAAVFRTAIEVEICEGRMPFDDASLHRLLTERVQEVPAHRVRVNGAHLVSPGSASSASMPAVRAPASEPSRAASMPPLRHPSELPRSLVPAPSQAPASSSRGPVSSSRGPVPSGRAPVSPSHAPVSSSRATVSPSHAPIRRTVSGIVRQDDVVVRHESTFTRVAPAAQAAGDLATLGSHLGRAVRSAAGSILLTALSENASQLADPLALLDGGVEPTTQRALVQEACIAMAYVLHRALVRAGLAERQAIVVVQASAAMALQSGQLPVSDMSRYFATDMPADEFHRSCCRILGITGSDAAETAIAELVKHLSEDAFACALLLQPCLRQVG